MQELHLKLKAAAKEELDIVSTLAEKIWNAHYVPIIGQQQVDYMLNRMYSRKSLEEQLTQKQHLFYLVALNDSDIQGFVSVNREQDDHWFLNKFYILPDKAAKGLGTTVFEELKKLLQPEKITLTVNRQNYKSINFYFKNGFKIDHVADFDIGDGYQMNDFVMVWEKSKVKS
jgi:ribosomal protein S18 acetylase RimI-like enzyme